MKKHYSILEFNFWKAYLITARPYLMFLSGISGIVGIAYGDLNIFSIKGLLLFIAFFISYGVGQALTDVFQTDTDSISSPYRPLTQGLITKTQVFSVSLFGLSLCGLALYIGNSKNLLFALLSIIGLVLYTFFKKRWWGGPFWNSWIVALLPIMGGISGNREILIIDLNLIYLALSVFFSYAIFVLLGYFKDISADRVTGYNTMPVVFGWNISVYASFVYCVLSFIFSILFLKNYSFYVLGTIIWGIGCYWLFYSHFLMFKIKSENDAHFSIAYVVRGFTWMHAGQVLIIKHDLPWILLIVCYLMLFELVLRTRPEVKQI